MLMRRIEADVNCGWLLILNPMAGRTEESNYFGPFDSAEELMTFYNSELVERYRDEGPNSFDGGTKSYSKCFRKGGPLEWMNPLEFKFPHPDLKVTAEDFEFVDETKGITKTWTYHEQGIRLVEKSINYIYSAGPLVTH